VHVTFIKHELPLPESTTAYAAAGPITGTEYVIDGGTIPTA